jgi:hypothetical protein
VGLRRAIFFSLGGVLVAAAIASHTRDLSIPISLITFIGTFSSFTNHFIAHRFIVSAVHRSPIVLIVILHPTSLHPDSTYRHSDLFFFVGQIDTECSIGLFQVVLFFL